MIPGMSIFKTLALVSCLIVASCAQAPLTAPDTSQSHAAISACTGQGGQMQQVGRAQTWQCILQYSDAGKACTDSGQCQGHCLSQDLGENAPAKGQCAADSNRFGCRSVLTNGVASPTLCID